MPKIIVIDNVEFIPASRAGKFVGYTPDYVSKLARENKIRATRNGRHWYVDLASLEFFKDAAQQEKHLRADDIRAERKLEQKLYRQQAVDAGTPFFALAQTAIVVLLGFWLGAGGYFVISDRDQQAQVRHNALERLAIAVYELFSPNERLEETTSIVEVREGEPNYRVTTEGAESTTTFTSLIVAPDELFTEEQVAEVRSSFSDEVEVSIDPEHPDTGIITPIFKDRRGEEYRFLMMPARPLEDGS
jgi:hypothetical protein